MNNDVEVEARPRPLSTGLWTLFSWLRRDDRSDSSESLSSAGSDRTVASFAFLTPANYQSVAAPLVLPPSGPPTDSYKKRVHDRNVRRQYDRDITLHRKYGLLKSGDPSVGYDAFSLPPVRRTNVESEGRRDRERRATSECFQRRLAHVPGKRRAPLPPTSASATSIAGRNTRKRRAPQPPAKIIEKNKENLRIEENTNKAEMNPHDEHKNRNNEMSMGCKSEKYIKKDGCSKDTKSKPEKSFLKQIFDSKKRNSAIDISSVKFLPSISELDKQAAEIIETCKLNPSEPNNNIKNMLMENVDSQRSSSMRAETWICINCSRKYNSSITTCLYCLTKGKKTNYMETADLVVPSTSKASSNYTQTEKSSPKSTTTNKNTAEEKQKLKAMLKEMKDSLPKRPKHESNNKTKVKSDIGIEKHAISSFSTETPTLRVGSTNENVSLSNCTTGNGVLDSALASIIDEKIQGTKKPTSVIVQPIIKGKEIEVNKSVHITNKAEVNTATNIQNQKQIAPHNDITEKKQDKKDLHTPLKISSLLNPVYVPKNVVPNKTQIAITSSSHNTQSQIKINSEIQLDKTSNNVNSRNLTKIVPHDISVTSPSQEGVTNKIEIQPKIKIEINSMQSSSQNTNDLSAAKRDAKGDVVDQNKDLLSASTKEKGNDIVIKQNQHSKRRDLIQKLEQSIAQGDEIAAADAAAKLAQLRLSCSVLSFSSQILSQPSTSTAATTCIDRNKLSSKTDEGELNKLQKQNSPPLKAVNNVTNVHFPKPALPTTSGSNLQCSKDQPLPKDQVVVTQKLINELKRDNTPLFASGVKNPNNSMVEIAVLVEDREATRGPVHLRIKRQSLMKDLRREAEISLGLAANLQRWIVGRVLCVNDNTPVVSVAGPNFTAPFYLCVVDSETKLEPVAALRKKPEEGNNNIPPQNKAGNVYTELVQLEQQALVPNTDTFECGVCMEEYAPGFGVVLRECVHIFCKDCLSDVVRHSEEPDISCPAMGCRGVLQEREIRGLVSPQDYERWLARGLAAAESGTRNAFHCRTRDCKGWALCEPGVQRFPCPVCKHINCVPCQAIHEGETCDQHREKLKKEAALKTSTGETDDGTRTLLNSLIAKGEALECPECSAIITKKWGCDWVKCSACKTEICWVTRGRRWGPGGKGDTSGGCRCGVDGKRCHPSCGYCH